MAKQIRGSQTMSTTTADNMTVQFIQHGEAPNRWFEIASISSDTCKGSHHRRFTDDEFNLARACYLQTIGALYCDGYR